jgi:hypothetical protein
MADEFTPEEELVIPPDPYPVTFVTSNGSTYEYAQRQTTLEDPVDVGSLATGRLAILGTQTSPGFYKAIDIVVGDASAITQHASVHSEPYLFTGTVEINNTLLTDAWHFLAEPFSGTQGVGTSWGITREYGFAFSNPDLPSSSYGFYYGPQGSPVTTGTWGVFIAPNDDTLSNYFENLVLIGDYTSVGVGGGTEPEPILQVLDGTSTKKGFYVENVAGIGTRPDTRYQLNVQKSAGATYAAKFRGDVAVGINTSEGLILTSPNGTKYRLIVNNAGIVTTALA